MDELQDDLLESISQQFGNDFETAIEQRNRSKIIGVLGIGNFWD
jgi:hypothetical protein